MSQLANKNNISKDTRNYLDTKKYIISEDLHHSLGSGILHHNGEPTQILHDDLVYLLMFRVLNYNSKVIIYNYISYPTIFIHTLCYFLVTRSSVLGKNFREPGNFLSVLDKMIYGENGSEKVIKPDKILRGKIEDGLRDICNSYYIYTAVDILEYINKSAIYLNVSSMSTLVDIAYNKYYDGFIKEILGSFYNYENLLKKLHSINKQPYDYSISLDQDKIDDKAVSIINSCLFLVRDINKLIDSIRNLNYNINCGPQPQRGRVNTINNSLSIIDMDYRKSLSNHNYLHMSGHSNRLHLSRDKFSFNNIHMNLGGIR